MTTLAHNAAVLEVPVDTALLFSGDPYYTLWLDQLVDRVGLTREAQMRSVGPTRYEDDG